MFCAELQPLIVARQPVFDSKVLIVKLFDKPNGSWTVARDEYCPLTKILGGTCASNRCWTKIEATGYLPVPSNTVTERNSPPRDADGDQCRLENVQPSEQPICNQSIIVVVAAGIVAFGPKIFTETRPPDADLRLCISCRLDFASGNKKCQSHRSCVSNICSRYAGCSEDVNQDWSRNSKGESPTVWR